MSAPVTNETALSHEENTSSDTETAPRMKQRLVSMIKKFFTLERILYLVLYGFFTQWIIDLFKAYEMPDEYTSWFPRTNNTRFIIPFLIKFVLVVNDINYDPFSTTTPRLLKILISIQITALAWCMADVPIKRPDGVGKEQGDLIDVVLSIFVTVFVMVLLSVYISILHWGFTIYVNRRQL